MRAAVTYGVGVRIPWNLAEPLLIDRDADRRQPPDLDGAVAVVIHDGAVLARAGVPVELPRHQWPDAELTLMLGHERLMLAPDNPRGVVALVVDETTARRVASGEPVGASGVGETVGFAPLRALLRILAQHGAAGARGFEIAMTAVALAAWHASHPRCSLCGEPTQPQRGGWIRRCPADGREHHPRTDPAVIVAITDADDRLLLAHAAHWGPGRYSHLAGYVEPGESLEQAVHREVAEEAGLSLTSVRYAGSQPWPFPASLMVAFTASATGTEITVDQEEITDARWVARSELSALLAAGEVSVPPVGSIARELMQQWYGEELD